MTGDINKSVVPSGTLIAMLRPPQLKSPLARAVVPVAAGIGFFALLAGFMWGIAALSTRGEAQTSDLLAQRTFQPGPAKIWASSIKQDGPILFADLADTDGNKTVVLDHTGQDPLKNWVLYFAHPADRPITCKVVQLEFTRTFTDCEGRTLDVEQLAPPPDGIGPVVSTDGYLALDLTPTATTDRSTPSTG